MHPTIQNLEITETSRENESLEKKVREFIVEIDEMKPLTGKPSICKVPEEFRKDREEFFKPISMPIGPLHHHHEKEKYRSAEQFKRSCFKRFIGRLENNWDDQLWAANLAKDMSSMEEEIRKCYVHIDPQEIPRDELVQIMLVDGCFIIELLLSHQKSKPETLVGFPEKVRLFTLKEDLLKLENQIPFFVLENLAGLARLHWKNKEDKLTDLVELALNFFKIPKPENFVTAGPPRHLLELVKNAVYHKNEGQFSGLKFRRRHNDEPKSALELKLHGIKFEAGKSDNPTKLEFKRGKLIIPRIEIDESTRTLQWNFFVFEMFACEELIFTSYVVMMDNLINTKKDVDILLESKILMSENNDYKSVLTLFNEMSAKVTLEDFYFAPLVRSMNAYCQSHYRQWLAYLTWNYYEVRWSVLSNILIFIFTVTQTYFAIPDLKKGK